MLHYDKMKCQDRGFAITDNFIVFLMRLKLCSARADASISDKDLLTMVERFCEDYNEAN